MSVESLAWLISRYRNSRRGRRSHRPHGANGNSLQEGRGNCRAEAYTNVTRQSVMAGLDRRGATPFAAKTFLKALRGLFRWAAENSFIERDPTEGVRIPSRAQMVSIRGRKTKSRNLGTLADRHARNGWR